MHGRREQRITLCKDGPIYEDAERHIEVRWDEISDLFVERTKQMSYRNQVVTTQGAFNFSPSIKDYAILCGAFAKFAAALPEAKWRRTETNVLSREASRWTSRCEGVGRHIYHYRTRTNRAMLWLAVFFACAPVLSVLLTQWTGNTVKGNPNFAFGMALFLGIPTLLGIWRYWEAAIETDADGITQRTLLGTRHLTWGDVEDYYKAGGDAFVFGIVKGARTRLWFWMGIGDVGELGEEIQRQARNSRHLNWGADRLDE